MANDPGRRKPRPVEYAIVDGKSMSESDIHRENLHDLIEVLRARFADDPIVYVSGALPVYYEEGDSKQRLAPDVFVVRGVENRNRDYYRIWEEGKGPDAVIELTSKLRRRNDQKKFELYRDVLKVPELFLIDPSGGCFESPLRGFRWSSAGYVPIETGDGPGLPSAVLGLNLARDGYSLRLFDPDTGRKLLTSTEQFAEAESMRAQIEKARRLVSMELDLAEMRRQLAENNLKITEAQLQLAETQLEQVMAEIQRLRDENETFRGRSTMPSGPETGGAP